MVRCPRCGRRLDDAAPVCALHGAAPPEAQSQPPTAERPSESADVAERERETRAAFASLGYTVDRILGRGGYGLVYGATRQSDGRKVAIKLGLREQAHAAEALAREANALELVGPPYVPLVYERGVLLDQYFVAIEFIAGGTLADQMAHEQSTMARAQFTDTALKLLNALEAIHAKRLVHRDLKPENIFIGDDGAKIIDFGLVKGAGTLSGAEDDAAGTPEYMSPEQCSGAKDADARSDIYSLGIILYELLSGAPPFWGKAADVRDAHLSRRPASLTKLGCSLELDAVIRRCLAKDRGRRFEDVVSVRMALQLALQTLPAHGELTVNMAAIMESELRAAAPVAPAPREKRNVGLAFFETRTGMHTVQPIITASGGQIVQMAGAQYVVAFGHDVSDNPVRIALLAAQRLLASRNVRRICVDLASVSVQVKPDGSRRLFSAVFTKKDRFPADTDPLGVMLTTAAHEVMPDLSTSPVSERSDRVLVTTAAQTNVTTYGVMGTPLVGRDDTLQTLLSAAKRAVTQQAPGLASVIAEPGYGKSHLFRVLALEAERIDPRLEVIALTARESIVGAQPQLLPELLRRVLALPESAPPDGGRALFIETLGSELGEQVWAAAAFNLGYIDAEHPDLRKLAAAPGALRLAAARAAGEALRRRAQARPVLVLIDDAHLADEAALDALEYATLKEAAVPLWACVFVRPHFQQARAAWGRRAAHSDKVVLEALTLDHAGELARRLLHPVQYVPPAALARLAARTQGVPRLMVELIRGLKRDGLVRKSARGTGSYLATEELDKLPDLPIVQWNASREVESLPSQLAGHARLCSILGNAFTLPELEGLLEQLESEELPADMQLDARVGIERLAETGLLVRHRSGMFEFRNALLRDTIYQQVSEAQRTKLHRAAYQLYSSGNLPSDLSLPRLALHAAACHERAAAADAYERLAERSRLAQAYLDAEAAFGKALEHVDDEQVERQVALERGRGLMRFRLGRQEDALKDLRKAREQAHQHQLLSQELTLCLDESTVLDWTLDLVQSAALVHQVEGALRDPSPLMAARLKMGIARVHHRNGEQEACVTQGAQAAELAGALGDEGYETRIISLLMVGTDCANLGRLDEAEQYLGKVIADAQPRADLHHLAAAYVNRAFLWYARKDVDRLLTDLARGTQIARETGDPLIEYATLINQAEVAFALEQLERANDFAKRALELAEQIWSKGNREVGTRELLMARIALYRGDEASARSLINNIRMRLNGPRAEGDELDFFPNDQALLEMVELRLHDGTPEQWQALETRAGELGLQPLEEVEIIEGHALAALAHGRVAESRASFERAISVSKEKPNLLGERVIRRYASLDR